MDALTTALTWLGRRELSTAQLRDRLARRRVPDDEIDRVVARLTADRTLDDDRVALAAARTEALVRRRGRRRILQRLQQMGLAREVAARAVEAVFADVDEDVLLDRAIERSLRGRLPAALDRVELARIVRRLVGQGFAPGAIYARLRPERSDSGE
jgi:SOS response regulatory protein OraA/RecX